MFADYDIKRLKQELARIEAKERLEKNRYAGQTEPLREQIRLLEKLDTSEVGATLLNWKFEQADAYSRELVYLLARQGDRSAFEAFNRKIESYLWCLNRLAGDGHEGALRSLAALAIGATEMVNRQALRTPDIFIPVAAEKGGWPILKSLHKQLDLIQAQDEVAFLERLHSGKNLQQDLSRASRYDPENPATEVAQKLLAYVRGIRRFSKFIYRGKLPAGVKKTDYLAWAGQLPDAAQDPEAAEKWWRLAKKVLLESYPELAPGSATGLDQLAPALLKISNVKNPAGRRKKILDNIKRKFEFIIAKPPGSAQPAY